MKMSPVPELFVFMSVAPAPELYFFMAQALDIYYTPAHFSSVLFRSLQYYRPRLIILTTK